VPLPFEVLFYVEFADFQTVEHDLHKYLDAHRISPNREFFEGAIREAVAYLYHHPRRLSCSFPRRPGEREPTIANVLGSGGPAQLVNPFEPSDAEAMRFAAEAIQAAKHGQEREGAQGD
jgi:hypothetical protein